MWWELYDGIDLYGGKITFVRDDSEDMFTVKFTDGMTIDVGSPDEGETYRITAVSSDDVEGWNRPLYETEVTAKADISDAVEGVIVKMRGGKRDAVDKNALVGEMLYMLFVHCKGLGAKYKYPELSRVLLICSELTKLLYRDAFTDRDKAVLNSGFAGLSGYLDCAFTRYNADDLVFGQLDVPEPANRMLALIHRILRFGSRPSFRKEAALLIHALHNLPRAYMTKRAEYFTTGNWAVRPEEALSYSDADLKSIKDTPDFGRVTYSSADITAVSETGVTFADGVIINFAECAANRRLQYPDSVSVAERDITAAPPYFDFFTTGLPTRIAFDRTGLSAKKHNQEDFRSLYERIKQAGYRTYDLS